MIKLDARDIQILVALQKDGTLKMSDLAEQVDLSITPCWKRVKRLEEARVITGYHASVDIYKVRHITEIFACMTLSDHKVSTAQTFERELRRISEVISCYGTTGNFDYLVQFVVSNIEHYQRITDALLELKIGLSSFTSFVVTKRIKEGRVYDAAILMGSEAQG